MWSQRSDWLLVSIYEPGSIHLTNWKGACSAGRILSVCKAASAGPVKQHYTKLVLVIIRLCSFCSWQLRVPPCDVGSG